MSGTWKTKYGLRRVRYDPPTLEEAIFAARGLTDDPQQVVEIAASLIDLPEDQVRAAVMRTAPMRKSADTIAFTGRTGAQRAVVVERRTPRRLVTRTA